MFSLVEKITVITGAGSGIGEATANVFAKAGAQVYVVDIDEENGNRVTDEINAATGKARFEKLDIAQEKDCTTLIDRLLKEHRHIDVLVNNAGVGAVGTILDSSNDDMDRLWSINVKGMYHLIKAVLPNMVERGKGSIINMASALGLQAMEDRFVYTTTKHAVVGLTRSIAYDYGASQVRVNCICAGRVETPFVKARMAQYSDPEKFRAHLSESHAQKRMAAPEEIANAALFLAADESSFMTGSAMVVDGGYTCGK